VVLGSRSTAARSIAAYRGQAVRSCTSLQSELKRPGGSIKLSTERTRECTGDEAPEHVPRGDASDTPIGFTEGCQTRKCKGIQRDLRSLRAGGDIDYESDSGASASSRSSLYSSTVAPDSPAAEPRLELRSAFGTWTDALRQQVGTEGRRGPARAAAPVGAAPGPLTPGDLPRRACGPSRYETRVQAAF